MSEDPLERLYTDRSDELRKQIADALDGVIGIDEGIGKPVFLDDFNELSNRKQVMALLLYAKAAALMGERDSEAIEIFQIDEYTSLGEGIIQDELEELPDHYIREEGHEYRLLDRSVKEVAEEFRSSW